MEQPIPIHPYDLYELLNKFTAIELIKGGEVESLPLGHVKIGENVYCQTTTIPPVTKRFQNARD